MDMEQIRAELVVIHEALGRVIDLLTTDPVPLPPPDPAIVAFRLADGTPVDPAVGESVRVEWQTKDAIEVLLDLGGRAVVEDSGVGGTGWAVLRLVVAGEITLTLTATGPANTKPATAGMTFTVSPAVPIWPGALDFDMAPDPTSVPVGPGAEIVFTAQWRPRSGNLKIQQVNPAYLLPPAEDDFEAMLDAHTKRPAPLPA